MITIDFHIYYLMISSADVAVHSLNSCTYYYCTYVLLQLNINTLSRISGNNVGVLLSSKFKA